MSRKKGFKVQGSVQGFRVLGCVCWGQIGKVTARFASDGHLSRHFQVGTRAALGEFESLEGRGFRQHSREPNVQQRNVLSVQVEECQAFVTRSQNRFARLEEQPAVA